MFEEKKSYKFSSDEILFQIEFFISILLHMIFLLSCNNPFQALYSTGFKKKKKSTNRSDKILV